MHYPILSGVLLVSFWHIYCVHITAQALVALALAAPLDTIIGLPLYKADFQSVKAKSFTLDGEKLELNFV